MYQVIVGEETQRTCETRAQATLEARELSESHGDQVVVTDEEGSLRMVYRRGHLENFVLETRARRGGGEDAPN